jgi:hypothetical protein
MPYDACCATGAAALADQHHRDRHRDHLDRGHRHRDPSAEHQRPAPRYGQSCHRQDDLASSSDERREHLLHPEHLLLPEHRERHQARQVHDCRQGHQDHDCRRGHQDHGQRLDRPDEPAPYGDRVGVGLVGPRNYGVLRHREEVGWAYRRAIAAPVDRHGCRQLARWRLDQTPEERSAQALSSQLFGQQRFVPQPVVLQPAVAAEEGEAPRQAWPPVDCQRLRYRVGCWS